MSRGFSLLEVLVALVILSLAIVTLMQLSSRGLRLLHLSDEYQQAMLLADRIAREPDPLDVRADAGREGPYAWERHVAVVSVPAELTPPAGPPPRLYALSVAVRWGRNQKLEVATLRTVAPEASTAAFGGPGR